MAYSNAIKQAVRASYVLDRLPLTNAAALHNVSYSTARSWKKTADEKGNSWDAARAASNLSDNTLEDLSGEILNDFLIQFKSTMDALRSDKKLDSAQRAKLISSLSDSLTKITSAFKRITPEISELAVAMDVVKLLGDFIKTNHPEQKQFFINILEQFGDELTAHYG